MAGLGIGNIGIVLIFLTIVMGALPSSPFTAFIGSLEELPYLSTLNWFLPVSEMIAVIQAWLFAVTAYYVISLVARWIKIIE